MGINLKSKLKVGIVAAISTILLQPVGALEVAEPTFLPNVVADATPDECFNGIGEPYIPYNGGCVFDQQPKTNQAYVWGMTKTDTHVWFGTVANTLCLVNGTYHQLDEGMITDSWVCELSESRYPEYLANTTGNDGFLALTENGLGDWRIPKIYRYNPSTGVNDDMTPMVNADPMARALLMTTVGLRSAGTHNGVVFLAGPGFVEGELSVNMFAFSASTGQFLGARSFYEYDNIRKWIVAGGELYTAVGYKQPLIQIRTQEIQPNRYDLGRVLKWTGNINNPFHFTEVGTLPGSGAELAYHEGKLFVTTWPAGELASPDPRNSGVYMSPVLPANGGLPTSATPWTEIWNSGDYEPDPVVAKTYGGGAIASFNGYLYWGTMHVPGVALGAAVQAYGLDTSNGSLMQEALLATNRSISIFRANNISQNGDANIDLLYGDATLKRYMPTNMHAKISTEGRDVADVGAGAFVSVPNKMNGNDGIWGTSGLGNVFNNYTWAMNVFRGKLYIGTMDWSYLALKLFPELDSTAGLFGVSSQIGTSPEMLELLTSITPGADLWRVESSSPEGAIAENLHGINNLGSYGIRTMVSDNDTFYLGMANPMNLMNGQMNGGWKLIEMKESPLGGLPIGSGGINPVSNDNPDTITTTTTTTGGGCTYNPNSNTFDIMYLILLMLSVGYIWRRKLIV